MFDKYEQQYAAYCALKEENDALKAQTASLSASSGKTPVLQALSQKAGVAEQAARTSEKAYLGGDGDTRAFLEAYMQQRREFHKYSMLRLKVN